MTAPTATPPAVPGVVTRRLLTGTADLGSHLTRHGPVPYRGGPGLLAAEVTASGLTGRGGGAFPVGRKLATVREAVVRRRLPAVVVANGAEGEPASSKDRTLLVLAPHLVLDGAQLAAEDVGADRVVLHLAGTAHGVQDVVRRALAERAGRGSDRVPVEVRTVPAAFVAGQESAVVEAVDGRAALPVDRVARVGEAGVRGRPTLVQNVESLAHLALVARRGAAWFRTVGTGTDPGSRLVTISGAVREPGVHEVAGGTALVDVLALCGGAPRGVQAVLVGGWSGTWVDAATALTAQLSHEGLAAVGGSPGAGVVVVLPPAACGLAETARITAWLAGQSARRCGPCHNGLPALAGVVDRLARPGCSPADPAEVRRLAGLVHGRGACAHPDGVVRMVASAVLAFDGEVRRHLAGDCVGHARAGAT